jgi:hypothetical protein
LRGRRHPDRLVVALASDEGQASRVARPSLPKIALRSSVGPFPGRATSSHRRRLLGVSTDRIATVRRIFELVNEATRSHRFPGEEAHEILDPGFRLDASRYVFNPGVYGGVDGFREFVDGILEMWEAVEIHPQELRESGEKIVALIVLRGRGREGVEVSRRGANVFTLRGDRVVEWIVGMDEREAMKEVVRDRTSEQAGRKYEIRPREPS